MTLTQYGCCTVSILTLWDQNGRTLTKAVKLGKCLESIKANAFTTSKYPVIITLEDHLTPKLQCKVAKVFHSSQSLKKIMYKMGM